MSVTGDMTEELCVNACSTAGYKYAGVEYAGECWCDNSIQNGGASTTTGCDMTCKGDSTELCGGTNHLNVFKRS
ncbi:hypothetical protein BD410DRAFT_839430 [Rickenella mellea]|uniref:WSC domain-containing protein n=1 Tax=Rickenella mellea TaxID=50990 RepID=A0A4Y7Q679_9AGAM|nr:hypothetical protein BD410DRAFT_839430 [Rickenella mellea]